MGSKDSERKSQAVAVNGGAIDVIDRDVATEVIVEIESVFTGPAEIVGDDPEFRSDADHAAPVGHTE